MCAVSALIRYTMLFNAYKAIKRHFKTDIALIIVILHHQTKHHTEPFMGICEGVIFIHILKYEL